MSEASPSPRPPPSVPPAQPCDCPPPAERPPEPPADPRLALLQLAERLMHTQSHRLLSEYLRLRRDIR